jgi:hypothetical protein
MDDPLLEMATHHVDDILHQVAARLSHRFAGVFNPQTVERCVFESYYELFQRARGRLDKPVPEVSYLCAYNAGRSQLAASLTERYAGGRVHVRCAGSHPADWLDLNVLEAMDEWGIEVEQLYPKPLTDDVLHGRVIRDDIDVRVRALVTELTTSGAGS